MEDKNLDKKEQDQKKEKDSNEMDWWSNLDEAWDDQCELPFYDY